MAYEGSEIMTAAALQYNSSALKKVKTYSQLQTLIKKGVSKDVQFGNGAIQQGFLNKMDINNIKSVADMAVGVSAALAIRNYIKSESKLITYMTGNVWPKEVANFQVSAYGFKDYNSSDIVVRKSTDKKKFYGISLKKKKTVKAADPTLINKTFSSVFDGKEYDDLKEKLVKTRINYFADVVIEAVDKNIIAQKDIKNFDTLKRSNKKELFEAKDRDKSQFGDKAYIDTKGYALSKNGGYLDGNTNDPKSMRYFVNRKLADKRNNKLWKTIAKLVSEGSNKLAKSLVNIILKQNLFEEIDAKGLDDKEFDFSLVTGIGDVKSNGTVSISSGKVMPLKTTLCGLKRIDKKQGKYEVVQDIEATNKSDAAKIFFKLVKGNLDILDLEVRYKGSFTPRPQFQGGITQEFKTLLNKECSG